MKNTSYRDCFDLMDPSNELLREINKEEAYHWEDNGHQGGQKRKKKIPQHSCEDVPAKFSTLGSKEITDRHDSGDGTSIIRGGGSLKLAS